MSFRLVVVTGHFHSSESDIVEVVRAALSGGADCVQLRERDLPDRALFRLAERLRGETTKAGARLVVNHRVDVAVATEADGIHLGWRSMSVPKARRLIGDDRLVGVSCHSVEEAQKAAEAGASYLFAGPVFDTPSKRGVVAPIGVEGLRAIRAAVAMPVIAIGGINADVAGGLVEAGAFGVAVIRAVMDAADPAKAAAELRRVVNEAR